MQVVVHLLLFPALLGIDSQLKFMDRLIAGDDRMSKVGIHVPVTV